MKLIKTLSTCLCLGSLPWATANDVSRVKNIAIIGAGSAGSSTAYYLRQYTDSSSLPLNITVFERAPYIGGRSTTVGIYNDPSQPVELGASIFVSANRNLVAAANAFNLSTSNGPRTRIRSSPPDLGIWNGREFVLVQTGGVSWWDMAKLFWKYGLAPVRALRLKDAVVGTFLRMYEGPLFPWRSLDEAVYALGLQEVTAATGEEFLRRNGVGELFAREVVQASTRVNYAQNLRVVHGLETMVCLATDGAVAVEGGNWQIFAHMLDAAQAHVRLNTSVTEVVRRGTTGYEVHTKPVTDTTTTTTSVQTFDEVVLAGPKQFSNIHFPDALAHAPDTIPYVKLHVTLFTSPHLLSPSAFNLAPSQQVPQVILTTLPPDEQPGADADADADADAGADAGASANPPDFFSISLLRPTQDTRPGRAAALEYVYKIFSAAPVNDTFLARILGLELGPEGRGIGEGDVSWMYRKVWDSYPVELPRVTFEELRLDGGDDGEEGEGPALWYTAGIESFISTMETSSLMGMNVARLMVDRWVGPAEAEKKGGVDAEETEGEYAGWEDAQHVQRVVEAPGNGELR